MLTSSHCCRCLDLGLQDSSIRGTFLSEGLLASALPLLQPSSVDGPAEALIAAIVALPEANHEGRAVQASLASTALVLHNRYLSPSEEEEFYMLQPANKSDRMCHLVAMTMRSSCSSSL